MIMTYSQTINDFTIRFLEAPAASVVEVCGQVMGLAGRVVVSLQFVVAKFQKLEGARVAPTSCPSCMTNFDIGTVPTKPGIYLLEDFSENVTYVGISKELRARLDQHFNRRDSSVTTGVAAACLNPDSIWRAKWWLDSRLEEKTWREAAELVAFDMFQPTLRSLGGISEAARAIYAKGTFKQTAQSMLNRAPDGEFLPLNLPNLLARVKELRERVEKALSK